VRRGFACVAALLAGCLQSGVEVCADGRTCPAGLSCDETHHLCLLPDQLVDDCATLADGDACDISNGETGFCLDGVCIHPVCGDGILTSPPEQCEPGQEIPSNISCTKLGFYDDNGPVGCNDNCTWDTSNCERQCGDGTHDLEEDCDYNDSTAISDCQTQGFYDVGPVACNTLCHWDVSDCTGYCGDNEVNGGEFCDGHPPSESCVAIGYDAGFLGCTACSPGVATCLEIGWRQVLVGSTSVVNSISGNSANDLWLAFDDTILHKQGSQWLVEPHDLDGALTTISETPEGEVWAGGHELHHRDASGWHVVDVPQLGTVYAVYAAGNDDVFVAGAWQGGAGVGHWDGTSWTTFPAVTASLWMCGRSGSDVYVFDATGVFHYDGTSWSPLTMPFTDYTTAVWTSPDGVRFAAGFSGGAPFLGYDDGSSWQLVPLPGITWIYGFTGMSSTDVLAVGSSGTAMHWNGSTWTQVGDGVNTLYAAWSDAADDIYAAGDSVLHFEGSVWRETSPQASGFLGVRSMAGRAADDVYALAQLEGAPIVARWDGAAWSSYAAFVGMPVSAIAVSPSELYAVGGNLAGGKVGRYNPATGNVEVIHSTGTQLQAAWAPDDTHLWVAGFGGQIEHLVGTTWTATNSGVGTRLTALWGVADDDVWAVGDTGTLLHWDGSAWSAIGTGLANLATVWGTSSTDVWVMGDAGVAWHWDGASWLLVSTSSVASVSAMGGTGPKDIFAAGGGGTILHYDGTSWAPVRSGALAAIEAMYASPDGIFFGDGYGWTGELVRIAKWPLGS
jgi:hypothetical protein